MQPPATPPTTEVLSFKEETASDCAQKSAPFVSGAVVSLGAAVLAFGMVAAYGIIGRAHSDAALAEWTRVQAVPSVDLVTPSRPTASRPLELPADIEAFYTAPIHARISGYVTMWYYDIGAHVKAGAVLARIDTPDLDQQLAQVKGELAKAQADYNLAQLTANRWTEMRGSLAVSQQTADEKTGDATAKKAQVEIAQADVDRIKAMEGFKDITAPFDGIVTARRIDVGALVTATGANDPGLFDVASVDKMRAYVRVPQVYTSSLRAGMAVGLKLPEFAGRTFTGSLATTSAAISKQSRAQLVELSVANPDRLLVPGSYAEATFAFPSDPARLVLPARTMIFRNASPQVAVVDEAGTVRLKPIEIARDTGRSVEVASGLGPQDRIVASPSDSLADGDVVRIASVDGKPADAGSGAGVGPLASGESASAARPAR